MAHEHQTTFCQKWILRKMDTFSSKLRSINEWCSTHDDSVDLELTWGVIKYLHLEMKWLTNSMTSEKFIDWCFEDFEILYYSEII